MIKQFSNLEKVLLIIATVIGGLMLLIPVEYLFLAIIGIIFIIYLLLNPKICFYTVIIASTFVYKLPLDTPVPFSHSDILITICFLGTFLRFMFVDKFKVNLRTKIDNWLIALLILYFFAGITSASHSGYQGFLRFGEALAVFYMTVYFIRTKTITISKLIKFILIVGLLQASIGIFQSITGIGSNYRDNRGYLGYLGLGSSLVWHGMGTMQHFNSLGPFLCIVFLFFLPINYFIVKNKRNGYIILATLFFGIITTYSRGSLIGLIAGILFFTYQIQKNKILFLLKSIPLITIPLVAWEFLKNTSYISTISPRNEQWGLAINAITQNTKTLLFGNGLRSYEEVTWQYLPGNVLPSEYTNYAAHNFFLFNAVEVGYLGLGVILSFILYILISAYNQFQNGNKLVKYLSLSISLIIFSIFFEGMFDYAFNLFVFQIWLYLFFGILYSKYSLKEKRTI